jgi:outer membrane protein, multidrug efflux system
MKRAALASLALVLLLPGCMSVGPDYQQRDPAVPSGFGSLEKGISSDAPVGNELLTSWWKVFQDPVLNELMDRAVTGNHDVQIARARVLQARALSMVATSAQFPEGGVNGSGERIHSTETGGSGAVGSGAKGSAPIAIDRQSNFFLAEFDATWEIDIFGGIRREIEAAQADFAA